MIINWDVDRRGNCKLPYLPVGNVLALMMLALLSDKDPCPEFRGVVVYLPKRAEEGHWGTAPVS